MLEGETNSLLEVLQSSPSRVSVCVRQVPLSLTLLCIAFKLHVVLVLQGYCCYPVKFIIVSQVLSAEHI